MTRDGMACSISMILVVALGGAAHAGQSASALPPSTRDQGLAGTWKLNAEKSEDFREKMRQADGGERGRRTRGGPGGGGPGGPGRGGPGGPGGGMGGGGYGTRGDPGSAAPPDGGRESMRRLAEPSDFLEIKTEGDVVLVGDDAGAIRRLYPDGRTMKTDNGEGQVRSRWDAGKLVTETVPASGPRYKETFSRSPDGRQLYVTVHLDPPGGRAVEVRRVYDATP